MAKKLRDDGGPAFPLAGQSSDDGRSILQEGYLGMTLRDYFAAKAMEAAMVSDIVRQAISGIAKEDCVSAAAMTAKYAYEYADAMLAERRKS